MNSNIDLTTFVKRLARSAVCVKGRQRLFDSLGQLISEDAARWHRTDGPAFIARGSDGIYTLIWYNHDQEFKSIESSTPWSKDEIKPS